MNGLSPAEMGVLLVLLALCAAVGWHMYRKASGRETSDVSGLHLNRRRDAVPPIE
jgi:hypothetical protein